MTDRSATGGLRSILLIAAFGARQMAFSKKTIAMIVLLLLPAVVATMIRGNAPPGEVFVFRTQVLPTLQIFLVEILCIFYGGSLIRDAMEDRTLGFVLTRPVGRFPVSLGFATGMVLFVLPMVLLSATVSWCACGIGMDGELLTGAAGESLLRLLSVLSAAAVVYSLLFVNLGLIASRPTILGLAFVIVVDGVLGSFPGEIRRIAPTAYLESLLSPHFATRASLSAEEFQVRGSFAISQGLAVVVLAAGVVFLLLLMRRVARRRDFIPTGKDL